MINFPKKIEGLVKRLARFKKSAIMPLLAEEENPILLMVGSLTGCTYKDAMAYTRGLAEQYVVAPALGRIHLFEDRENARYVYEIHEGGPGKSIGKKVIQTLQEGRPVSIRLANGAYVSIQSEHNELFSLIFPEENSSNLKTYGDSPEALTPTEPENIFNYVSSELLQELYPENQKFLNIGGWILTVSSSLLIVTGFAYTVVQSGVLDSDALLTLTKAGYASNDSDNPVWQIERARADADSKAKTVRTLKKDSKGWSWELSQ